MLCLFAIFDKKLQEFTVPMFSANSVEMHRSMTQVVRDRNTSLARFPDDYQLYEVGRFDPRSGLIVDQNVSFVCEIKDFCDV